MSDFDDGGKAWPFGDKNREDQTERMERNKSATCVCGRQYYIQNGYWDHKMCVNCLTKQTDALLAITEVCKILDCLADVLEYRDMTAATDAIIDALERAMMARKIICEEGEE